MGRVGGIPSIPIEECTGGALCMHSEQNLHLSALQTPPPFSCATKAWAGRTRSGPV